jgi:acetylornithine deacetylase/succinyl-diaminopimelate desuccinylase-like protein
VRAVSPAERAAIASLPWDDNAYRTEVGVTALWGESGFSTLERQWVRPTLEVNGLGGGYAGEGSKTVIPSDAFAKLTCRLVPDQEPDRILELVDAHLHRLVPPGVRLHTRRLPGSARAYRIRHDHPGLQIARDVLRDLYGRDPVEVLIGGTLPVTEAFARILGIDTVFFSFSTADEDFHAPNEFFRLDRLRVGIRAWVRYWQRAASMERATPLGGARA